MSLRRISRVLVGVAALAALLMALPGARAENGINAVGTLERFPQEAVDAFGPGVVPTGPFDFDLATVNGTLLPVPGAGQLWQLYRTKGASPTTGVLVRDAKNLKVLGTFRLPEAVRRATTSPNMGGEWLHTTDGGNRVFLMAQSGNLLEVDASTFTVLTRPTLTATLRGLSPLVIGGLSYDPYTDDLLLLYGGPANMSLLNKVTVLQQLDVSGPPSSGLNGTSRVIRSCDAALPATDVWGDTYATAPLPAVDAVYVPCQKGGLGAQLPPSSVVVRLPRSSLLDSTGEETSIVTGGPMNTALLDPSAGRITVLGFFNTMTVVDTASMAVVGSFAASQPDQRRGVGAGLNPTTGRVFFQSDLGLGHVDARGPAPFVPTVATSAAAPGTERIVTSGNRIFVLTGSGFAKPDRYTIYNVGS